MEKDCPYTICMDRLELIASCTNPFWNRRSYSDIPDGIMLTDEVKLYPCIKNNPFFNYSFDIHLKEQQVASFFCGDNHRLRYKISNPTRLNLANNILYEEGLHEKLKLIFNALGLTFYKYAYAEIAIDGYDFIQKQKSLMESDCYHRKQPLQNVSQTKDECTGKIKSIVPGSRFGDKHISIYDKQSEVQAAGKTYIEDFWKMNGLLIHPEKQIDRIELRLKRKQAEFLEADFSQLSDATYLSSFFRKHGGHYLEYIHNEVPKKRKHIIDWSAFKTVQLAKVKEAKQAASNASFKPVIKKLYLEFHRTGKEYYMASYEQLAETYGLRSWLYLRIEKWKREYRLR